MNKVLSNRKVIALFVIPALILFTGLVVVPVLWSFYYSLYKGTPGLNWKFTGLTNYRKLFIDAKFHAALMVTIEYILMTMLGMVILGLLLSLIYCFWLDRFKNIVKTITFFPVVLPTVAVGQLFKKIYEIQPYYGLLNSLLAALGRQDLIQPWIGQQSTALKCLSIMDIWVSLGFYAVIFYGGLLDISEDVIEAAKIDGCNSWQLFTRVLLPLLRPVTITCLVFAFAGTVKMFESAMALTGGGPASATTSLSMYMYNVAFEYRNYGYGSAVAIVIFLICIIGTQIIKRFDVKEND